MLDNWKKGDDALEKHKQLYPSCNFLQGLHSASNLGSSSHSAFSPPATSSFLQPMPSTSFSSLDRSGYFSNSYASFPQDPVTSQGVEELSHLRPNHCNPSLSTEEARLSTFKTWTVPFLSPSELAKAGFFYSGPGDKVACFTCGGQLNNWEPKDNALSEHRRHFPNCSFLESLMTEQSRLNVSNVGMQTYTARLKTFISWPSRIPVRPEQLANAGFYYVGRNDDVKCFCCDGGLRCWESGDDPWIEHAKWFPRCEYLLMIKKQEFVDQIQARFPHLLEQLYSTSDTPVDETEGTTLHLDPGEYNKEDAVMMNTPVVKAALEMGFSTRLVKQTVQSKILATNENYKTVNELVSDLLTAKNEKDEEDHEKRAEEVALATPRIYLVLDFLFTDDLSIIRKNRMALFQRLTNVLVILKSLLSARVINELEHDIIKQKTQSVLQARELIDIILVKGDAAATVFRNCLKDCDPSLFKELFVDNSLKYTPTEDISGLPMEEQLRRLQEERTCKVCMDKEVSIVFIPCGHLVVCKECAPSLRKCPICRGTIKGTVRTFLS